MGKRGVPGAEVVDRDANAELLDRGQSAGGFLDVAHERRLGDLDRERPWLKAAVGERRFHVSDQLIAVELARRDVDGHADRITGLAPRGALSASVPQNPLADLG